MKSYSRTSEFRLLPKPRELQFQDGVYRGAATAQLLLSAQAERIGPIIAREWEAEFSGAPSVRTDASRGYGFALGTREAIVSNPGTHPEAYTLDISPGAIRARANSYSGLVHAWQTLKQILRRDKTELPCLRIRDAPQIDWRMYHVDMKGTRRRLSNLHEILPQFAELKINALLVEYEDYIKLERHPGIAVPEALSKRDVARWIRAAADYGIAILPLVQTLGHLQYALCKPQYAALQEKPGDPAEACPRHPGTWPLIRDFLDEMLELHATSPFIHVGLDETFNLGTCPRCRAALGGRPKRELYIEWLDRVCQYVVGQGKTPLVWGDMVLADLDADMAAKLNRDAVYFDWGYCETDSTHPYLRGYGQNRISRDWLRRPNADVEGLPSLKYTSGCRFYEDLSPAERAAAKALADNPQFPLRMKTGIGLTRFAQFGLKRGETSGIRVSFHGCVAPKFIAGQLNTIAGANACKEHGGTMFVGSSWSRGGSFAGMNAHPELDWYGIATLSDSTWSSLELSGLREFDERFGFHFFGFEDGRIGDLYFMFERTGSRVDHRMDNYLGDVQRLAQEIFPQLRRNHDRFRLFREVVAAQVLRFRAQFALLEMEYFYSGWHRVPADFKERMARDVRAIEGDMASAADSLRSLYAKALIESDASELVATQLDFFRDNMALMSGRLFGEPRKEGRASCT